MPLRLGRLPEICRIIPWKPGTLSWGCGGGGKAVPRTASPPPWNLGRRGWSVALTPGPWDAAYTGLSFPLCKVKLSILQEPEALHDLAPGKDASLLTLSQIMSLVPTPGPLHQRVPLPGCSRWLPIAARMASGSEDPHPRPRPDLKCQCCSLCTPCPALLPSPRHLSPSWHFISFPLTPLGVCPPLKHQRFASLVHCCVPKSRTARGTE